MSNNINSEVRKVIDDYYQNVSEKNLNGILELLSDTIDWYMVKSEYLPWTGHFTNKAKIKESLDFLFNAHIDEEDSLDLDHIFFDENNVAVFGKISRTVKITGKRFTTAFCQRFTIENGKITKFLMLEDTPAIEKAFK